MNQQPYTPIDLPISDVDWVNHIKLIGNARHSIAKFEGLVNSIPSPEHLLAPLISKEAVLSSRIEGTQATLEDLLKYDAQIDKFINKSSDVKEIVNYRNALNFAISELKNLPLGIRLIKATHKILLDDSRSETGLLGEFRKGQVYIGKLGTTIDTASYIPPEAFKVPILMDNLEKYIHLEEKDPLVQIAIIHAQFEMIHPFWDGNGRVGRMLIPLFLTYKNLLSRPMFYISEYFEQNREEYLEKLSNISKNGDWNSWIVFFLTGVIEQANTNCLKVNEVLSLYQSTKKYFEEVIKSSFSMRTLDFIFSYPIFSTQKFISTSNLSRTTAQDLLDKLVKANVLVKKRTLHGNFYFAPEVYKCYSTEKSVAD